MGPTQSRYGAARGRGGERAAVYFQFLLSQVLPARIVVRNRQRVRIMAQANLEESFQN